MHTERIPNPKRKIKVQPFSWHLLGWCNAFLFYKSNKLFLVCQSHLNNTKSPNVHEGNSCFFTISFHWHYIFSITFHSVQSMSNFIRIRGSQTTTQIMFSIQIRALQLYLNLVKKKLPHGRPLLVKRYISLYLLNAFLST